MASFIRTIATTISLLVAASTLAQGQGLPSTQDFMNILTLCGAGSGIKIDGDLRGSISSLYEKEKTQGKAVQDIIAKIIELMPQDQRLPAYNAYLGCVDRRLSDIKSERNLELSGVQSYLKEYSFSVATIIEINIRNRGTHPDNISKIALKITNIYPYRYDPCPMCMRNIADGIYNIHFAKVVGGANEFIIPHTVAPNTIEKIVLVLGGDFRDQSSYLARITVGVHTGSAAVLESLPIDVLVQNFDRGHESPLSVTTEAKLSEFISSGAKAPEIANKVVIRRYFAGGDRGGFGARLPALPGWF